MSDVQKARDYADQKQFKANIQNFTQNVVYNIEGEEARAYLVQLFRDNFPKMHAEAMAVATTCAEEMAVAVIAEIHADDPEKISNLRRPSAQSALLAAQESYARTGDPDTGQGDVVLGQLLAKLVAHAVIEPTRSLKEIALRRAIDVAPNLTEYQFNTLSVMSVTTVLYFRGDNPEELVEALDHFFCVYYKKIIDSYNELSYMAASGVGTVLFGLDVFAKICDRHKAALRKDFDSKEIPDEVTEEFRSTYLEAIPNSENRYRLRAEKIEEMTAMPGNVGDMATELSTSAAEALKLSRKDPKRVLRTFVSKKFWSGGEFKELVQTKAPQLHDFFQQLDDVGTMHFNINTIGYMLASQELSLRFPGTDLLGPVIELESASPDDEAGPRSTE